jgi:hypothetical protein
MQDNAIGAAKVQEEKSRAPVSLPAQAFENGK